MSLVTAVAQVGGSLAQELLHVMATATKKKKVLYIDLLYNVCFRLYMDNIEKSQTTVIYLVKKLIIFWEEQFFALFTGHFLALSGPD